MSPVPRKITTQDLIITLEDLFRDRLDFLGVSKIVQSKGWKKPLFCPHVKLCRKLIKAGLRAGVILVLSPTAAKRLLNCGDQSRREYLAGLVLCKTAALIIAQSAKLGDAPQKLLESYHPLVILSSLDEYLLKSRISAILEERIKKRMTIHGVALEFKKKGILITGASGIGKTTAALAAIAEGYQWIADDRVVIKKNAQGKLLISGLSQIKKYCHTTETGIVMVDRIIDKSQIKNKAELALVIDVTRTDNGQHVGRLTARKLMEARLPLISVGVSRTGYFNKNLLFKAVNKLNEVG